MNGKKDNDVKNLKTEQTDEKKDKKVANVLAVEERVQQGVLPPARVLARQSA